MVPTLPTLGQLDFWGEKYAKNTNQIELRLKY